MEMEMLADKSRYTYRYYRDRYITEIIEPAKKKYKSEYQQMMNNPNIIISEDAFIYVHFIDELHLRNVNNMQQLAQILDKQLVYADDSLKDVIFDVWGQIINICDNSTDETLEKI